MREIVYIGSELKLNVNIDPINGKTMDQYNFECEFYCHPAKRIKKTKEQMRKVDSSNYIALVDTQELGIGNYHVRLQPICPTLMEGPMVCVQK